MTAGERATVASAAEGLPPARALVVDDDATVRRAVARVLLSRGFRVDTADGGESALASIAIDPPDVALVDLSMPEMNGLEVLKRIRAAHPSVVVVMMTAYADMETAVTAVKLGAFQFLTKPFTNNEAVAVAMQKAVEYQRLTNRAAELERRFEAQERVGELLGTSAKMQAVYRLIEGVAATTSTVLVLGESGTGKELVARAVHQHSARSTAPFVAVNCAAIPRELVESELFGHERGAFTGAHNARAGLFESAHRGTVFLDEVGDLPLPAQVKLLRTLQESEIKRVGSDETKIVDVRVLAATNEDLIAKITNGTFRRDLFYRLNVIAIKLPALRERGDDVLLLAHHFIQRLAVRMRRPPKTFAPSALLLLREHAWPGNVRELENAVEHAFVLSPGKVIEAADLPVESSAIEAAPSVHHTSSERERRPAGELFDLPYAEAKRRSAARFDEVYVTELIRRAGGNLAEAARQAGLDRANFRRLVRKQNTD